MRGSLPPPSLSWSFKTNKVSRTWQRDSHHLIPFSRVSRLFGDSTAAGGAFAEWMEGAPYRDRISQNRASEQLWGKVRIELLFKYPACIKYRKRLCLRRDISYSLPHSYGFPIPILPLAVRVALRLQGEEEEQGSGYSSCSCANTI